MKNKKTCDNCVNKYLCPNFNKFGTCMGWGNREVFIGLIKLNFGFLPPIDKHIDKVFENIKKIQEEKL